MNKHTCTIFVVLAVTGLTGCALDPTGISQMVKANEMQKDSELYQQRQKLTLKFQSSPDTDAWHDQRQKIALATGDRVVDKDFARV